MGTGFFVAPATVLTCAHVAADAEPGTLGIWIGREWYAAELRFARPQPLPPDRIAAFPDLAVLQVAAAPADHACVWLGERWPDDDAGLHAYGFERLYTDELVESTRMYRAAGETTIRGGLALRFLGDEADEGMSGSPLLDGTTGEVCAMVKSARQRGTERGGVGIVLADALRELPVELRNEIRRAHDRWHADKGVWTRILQDLTGARESDRARRGLRDDDRPLLRISARTALFGALAGLPAPVSALAEARAMLPDLLPGDTADEAQDISDYRDVVRYLDTASQGRRGELHPLPDFLRQLVARYGDSHRDAAGTLWNTAEIIAQERGERPLLGSRPSPGGRGTAHRSVIVKVASYGNDLSRYQLSFAFDEDGTEVSRELEQAPLSEQALWGRARERLSVFLDELGAQSDVIVRFLLTGRLLRECDQRFEDWQLWAGTPWRLGERHPVVVGALEPFGPEGLLDPVTMRAAERERAARWTALHRATTALPTANARCVDNGSAEIRDNPETWDTWYGSQVAADALVLLQARPRDEPAWLALAAGVLNGLAIAFWPREDCDDASRCGSIGRCSGANFQRDLASELDGTLADAIPGRSIKIRRKRRVDGRPGLVFFWNKPTQPFRYVTPEDLPVARHEVVPLDRGLDESVPASREPH
ncbi:hypothetical protein BL253_22065 [Pseudofrankia asymbiotica]|uniref:Serine protease n=1 Tax=Pseudofrankia asymbiotica TaxID=1834516 RepID=A0A1V2I6M7_9ACTN|nr:hypothetical protein BL253_22065 [Pseudofrankia asymbiotica]